MSRVKHILQSSLLVLTGLIVTVMAPTNVIAGDITFFGTNDIIYYDPDVCSTDGSTTPSTGAGSVGAFKNPVYSGSAPDPSVVMGDDGKFHVFATGNVHLTSTDMVSWKKVSNGWNLKGAPNDAGGDKWAPDVIKLGSKWVLTYTIPTGTPENPGGGPPKIGYAIADSVNGPFNFKNKLNLPYTYSIDSHLFQDDGGKIWLFWGGGAINVIEVTFDGNTLKVKGSSKQLLTKGGVGSTATIEGAWVSKHDGWYYLTYSQGHYKRSNGPPEYRVLVARSKTVNGNYTPDNSMKPILEGKGDIHYPGHHSIITDASGTDWIVYHGYYKNEQNTRSLMIDKISYQNGWPIVNNGDGPSSSQQQGSSGSITSSSATAPTGQVKVGQANIKVSSPDSTFKSELDRVIGRNPDFVSGNEWSSRTNNQIKRSGYEFYRDDRDGGDVVMWKSDKWTKVATGTVAMTTPKDKTYTSPFDVAENNDAKRSIAWVTVQDSSGSKVSFISLHHMVNPNKIGPQPERKALYKLGLERAAEKIKELHNLGPVVMAGDFNAQKGDDGPWHPRQVLGNIGMESTHDSLPKVEAYVDYIFYTKDDVKPISHSVPFKLFDHPYLEANLQFTQGGSYSSSDDSAACTCKAADSGSQLLQGSDNEQKAWNFLTSKGLSPEQAAGIMGNISIESHFDPKASNGGNYMGISQWDSGGRWAKYKTWAQAQNLDIYSFDAQMQYTYKEGQDRGNIEGIKKYNDVEHTAWYWGRFFEVAIIGGSTSETPLTNVQALKERTDEAKRFFAKYGGTSGTSSGGSSTSSESSASCPDSGDGSLANATCSNVDAKPPEDYGLTKFPGTSEKTDKRTLYMVNLANDCLKQQGEKPITVVQGSYCAGSCAGASGSSHDKGATIDIRTSDRGGKTKIMLLLKILREVGFAAWYRDGGDNPSFAGNEHIHAVALGAPLTGPNAPGSPDQLILYCTGGDGLKGGQKDRQLAIVGRPLPEWALHVKPTCTRYPK